jgi:hypothetical protein
VKKVGKPGDRAKIIVNCTLEEKTAYHSLITIAKQTTMIEK